MATSVHPVSAINLPVILTTLNSYKCQTHFVWSLIKIQPLVSKIKGHYDWVRVQRALLVYPRHVYIVDEEIETHAQNDLVK